MRDEHLYALHVLTIRILRSPRIDAPDMLVQRDFIVLPVCDANVRMA